MRLQKVAIHSVASVEQHVDIIYESIRARGVPETPRFSDEFVLRFLVH